MSREWQPELRVIIDYDQLIWQALQNCNNAFLAPVFSSEQRSAGGVMLSTAASEVTDDRFERSVRVLRNYILPEWYKPYPEFEPRIEEEEDPYKLHRAIIQLLEAKKWFRREPPFEEIPGARHMVDTGLQTGSSPDRPETKTVSSS